MICDFHSHALFNMDDGARDIATSLEMLKKSKEMGVTDVLLTSHCYPRSSKDVSKFLDKREAAYSALEAAEGLPRLHKGCEVHLTGDITRFSRLRELCIENTSYMLLEMPRAPWNDNIIDVVYKLNLMGITPIIAHDERNMHQKKEMRNALYDMDVLLQINAPSLFMLSFRKEIDRMMKLGLAHVIGTDMHNTTSRKPCMDKAEKRIKRRYGEECWNYLMGNAEKILRGEEISYREFRAFKKKGLF